MATKPSYKYALSLDEECKAIIDRLVESGKAPTFTEGVRMCIRKQGKRA